MKERLAAIEMVRGALIEVGRPDLAAAIADDATFPSSVAIPDRALMFKAAELVGRSGFPWLPGSCYACWAGAGYRASAQVCKDRGHLASGQDSG